MSTQIYTATKTRSNRPGWSVTFKHPKRRDSRGRCGLKVRRGLNTSDDNEADRLVAQMNELLADQYWLSVDRRKEAAQRFDEKIVAAFFDGMEAGKINSADLRNTKIELPNAQSGYSRVLLTGTTGAGKTTLLRHLIGSNHTTDRFPSTSTARTTTAEIEIIVAESPFAAAVTFMPEHEIRAHLDECLEEACLNAIQAQSMDKIASALLSHREQRFRLSYILGQWGRDQTTLNEDDFSFEDGESPIEAIDECEEVAASEIATNAQRLDAFLERIKALAVGVGEHLAKEIGALDDQKSPDDRASWLEMFGDTLYEYDEFSEIALDILEDVKMRFSGIQAGNFDFGPTGWPVLWNFESASREEFLQHVRWFSSNHHKQFGKLLTPLVDGLRVKGPFFPALDEMQVAPKLVLLDGEGIGHSAKSASSISTRITRRFADVDMILIVDNAEQPMQTAPLELLRSVGNSGHGEKLAVAFTHFDLVKGPNLKDHSQKRAHVLNSVRDAINTLKQSVGVPVASMLEDQIESHAFYLGGLDREIDKIPSGYQKEIVRLLATLQEAAVPAFPVEATPIYSVEGLEIALRDAVEGFQSPWKARLGLKYRDGIAKEHWTRIKALSRRLANAWANEYDSMRPVADLVTRLQENISKWLDSPSGWSREPKDKDERIAAIAPIRKAVFSALHDLAENRLADLHRAEWTSAFDEAGRGSGQRRVERINGIYEDAAPLVSSAMNESARKFLHQLHQIVREAVDGVGGRFRASSDF